MRYLEVIRRLYRNRIVGRKPYSAPALNEQESAILSELKKDGIVVLKGYIDKATVEQMLAVVASKINNRQEEEWRKVAEMNRQKEYSWGVKDPDGTNVWADPELSDRRVWHAELLDPSIAAFGHNESFRRIGENYLKQPMSLRFTLANHTRFINNNRGSGGGWHRDNNYINSFKALVYLVDTDEMNGNFQYLKKSFTYAHHILKTPFPDKYQFTPEEVLGMVSGDESKIFNVKGKAGDVVLFDTNGIHRGKPLQARERFALTNYYHH
jgi:hypothetical protein